MQIFLPYSACGIPIDVNESTMCADDANDIYSMDQGKEFCPQCYEISIIHPAREPQAAAKKKKSCTYSVWESHHPPSQNLLNWNRAVFQFSSWKSEETWWVLHGDREWGLSNKISYFLCVNKSVRIFLNDLSLVLYLKNAAFLMLMCRHADFSTTFITLWTGIQYPPLCQS